MLSRFIAFGLLIAVPVFAADDCDPQVIDQGVIKDLQQVSAKMKIECPNQVNVADLCQFVADETAESNSQEGTKYTYQTKIYKASCVVNGDAPEVIQAKIQAFWNKYHDQLVCNVLNSSVRNGHILKLAVNRTSTEFIKDAARRWKVNINHIDTDNKTVLDYINDELAAAKGTSRENTLNNYLQIFRASGGKYRREL